MERGNTVMSDVVKALLRTPGTCVAAHSTFVPDQSDGNYPLSASADSTFMYISAHAPLLIDTNMRVICWSQQ